MGIFQGDGEVAASSYLDLVSGVNSTRFIVGERLRNPPDGVAGRLGRSLSRFILPGEAAAGKWVPAATLMGSSENLGGGRWRMDFMFVMLPSLAREDRYFLLPSVFETAGVPRVLVEGERLSEGIMLDLMLLTLAARASDDLVGVVTAAGRPDFERGRKDVVCLLLTSGWLSLETGRVAEVSSW